MKTTLRHADGSRTTVTAIHSTRSVLVSRLYPEASNIPPLNFWIPADLAGVFAQAIELAAERVGSGPCAMQLAQADQVGQGVPA